MIFFSKSAKVRKIFSLFQKMTEVRTFGIYRAEWTYLSALNEDESEPDPPRSVEVSFFVNDELKYTKSKNNYRTQGDKFMLLEWFTLETSTVFLFNEDHGCIGVYDADSGELLHTTQDDDLFISNYQFFDDKQYLYVAAWFWLPIPVRYICHVPTLLTTPDYESMKISCLDVEDNYSIPEISLFGCSTCQEFMEKHDQIFETMLRQQELQQFNKNRTKDILLKRIFDMLKDDEAKTLLGDVLSTDLTSFNIKTIGGNSLAHLSRYDSCLFQEIEIDNYKNMRDMRGQIPENTVHNVFSQILFGQTNALPFDELHLKFGVFTNLGNLSIVMRHKLVPDPECGAGSSPEFIASLGIRCKIDPTAEFAITCTIKEE
jgi:hypothetical protein